MNKSILLGRLVRDPETTFSTGEKSTQIAKFCLAVDRKFQKGQADFINCIAFGKTAEFVEKYFAKGAKVLVTGRIQTGSYTNKEGQKVYTTDVVVEEVEFGESKSASSNNTKAKPEPYSNGTDGFINIPDGIDEELPFS
jgi:single-strand DNA-binding protein